MKIDLTKISPSGSVYSSRPNYMDLSFDYNDVPRQGDTAIIVTSWYGHLHFLEATLKKYKETGAFILCAYDNPLNPWEKSEDLFKKRMPDVKTWTIPHAWVFKHVTFDNNKRDGWLWLMDYAQGVLRQNSNFRYILHVNGDCIWENPEGLQDLKNELGDHDLMSVSSERNTIHTAAVIYKAEVFHSIMDFIRKLISPPIVDSLSPEDLLTTAVRVNQFNEKIASIQPMHIDQSSIDHYSKYNQNSTWKECVGYMNLGAIFLASLIQRTEPVDPKFIDIEKMKSICGGYSHSLYDYYRTSDRRYLYQAWDQNEDSWYDRIYMPIEFYGNNPIHSPEDNRFERTMTRVIKKPIKELEEELLEEKLLEEELLEEIDLSKINKFSWYQTIDFGDGVISKGSKWCGDPAWSNILKFLPESLENKRILDLGCNAGIFCIRSSLLGAKEVIGVESNDWRKDNYLEQAFFVKDVFSKKYKKDLNIEYVCEKMEDYLMRDNLGFFDFVYGIASLYYSTKIEETISNIAKITNNAIIRVRDKNRIEKIYNSFISNGFSCVGEIREEWWKILKIKTDDFYLFHFGK